MSIAFGPVPSRRLGRSLGINNIPPKSCSYSCLYCQVGATQGTTILPQEFYQPETIQESVKTQLEKVRGQQLAVDYLTFVPDGEPGLDSNLAETIELLRPMGIPIAIISNASLLWREEVRSAMCLADWVSVKVDTVEESTWKTLNRPDKSLRLADVLEGIRHFADQFSGTLVSETMLVEGINDNQDCLEDVAEYIHELGVDKAYLSIPIRPPAEAGIRGPEEKVLNSAYQVLAKRLPQVEYLIGYEGDAVTYTGDIQHDLLSITAVHPLRKSAVQSLLDQAETGWQVVDELVAEGKLVETEYQGKCFYLRRKSK
ncbi:MAG: radical SAM protein [Thiohalophilus sp.]|jgi:wyosine [tRNA(Phe)-imidazoG37] synthetase (radical SAM superfamily)